MSDEKKDMNLTVQENVQTLPTLQSARDLFAQVDTGELVAELKRRVTGAWAYQFPMDGKPVKGLSAPGARESAAFIAHQTGGQLVIRPMELFPVIEEPDCFKATIKAGLYVIGIDRPIGKSIELLTSTSFGYAKQPKYGKRAKDNPPKWKKGDPYTIAHAESIAVSKAERNAIAHLIPDKIKQAILKTALQEGRVEFEEGGESKNETPLSSNGEKQITTSQLNLIRKLLKSPKVTDQHRDDFKKAFDKGMTSKQASKWIEFLNDFIGKEKTGDLPL